MNKAKPLNAKPLYIYCFVKADAIKVNRREVLGGLGRFEAY